MPGGQVVGVISIASQTRKPMDDPRVRRAFSMAIDRNRFVNRVNQIGTGAGVHWSTGIQAGYMNRRRGFRMRTYAKRNAWLGRGGLPRRTRMARNG